MKVVDIDIDWKVLSKVMFLVFSTITFAAAILALLVIGVEWFGKWMLLLIPVYVLIYVIKRMYHDEMVRQVKRQY